MHIWGFLFSFSILSVLTLSLCSGNHIIIHLWLSTINELGYDRGSCSCGLFEAVWQINL